MSEPTVRLEILIPHEDARSVRTVLSSLEREWTEQHRVHGGWSGHRYWRLWLMLPEDQLHDVIDSVQKASPPRQVWYHPRHGWATDAWLHPTTITLTGAVFTWWPVTTTAQSSEPS